MKIDQITWKVNLFYIALTHLMHCYGLDVLCAKQHAVSWYNLLMLDMPRYRLYWRGGRTENSRLFVG